MGSLPGVERVEVVMGVMDAGERAALMDRARPRPSRTRRSPPTSPPPTRVLAVSSGKGGVGKSSVTVNLAVALARRGLVVGLLDADIWGFSVPRLLGMQGELRAEGRKIVPLQKEVGTGLLKVVSMGFLADEDSAIMWRGLILNRAVQQFLEDVRWGDARLPAHRHAPGDGRHPDGPGPHAPPHRGAGGHHATARRPEGGGTRRRHGPQGPSPGGGRGREHVGLHLRSRRHLRAVRRGRGRAPGGGDRRAPGGHRASAPRHDRRRRCRDTRGPAQRRTWAPPSTCWPTRVVEDIAPVVEVSGCTARMLEHVEAALEDSSPARRAAGKEDAEAS